MLRIFLTHVVLTCGLAGVVGVLTSQWDLIPLLGLIHISAFTWVAVSFGFYPLLIYRLQRSPNHSFAERDAIRTALRGEPSGPYPAIRASLRPFYRPLRLLRIAALGVLLATTFNAISMWLMCLC